MSFVLAIDQGTTSTRAMLFRADTSVAAVAQREFPQYFPADGEVEHEPEDLWATTIETCRTAMRDAGARAADIAAIGIANQRETTLLWHRATGRALHRAIVWQDRRTAGLCTRLEEAGHEPAVTAKTGLVLAASDWTMQRLADLIARPVDRPQIKETTALGAAYLAGLQTGFFPEPDRFVDRWRLERRFTPQMDAATRERKLVGWSSAVRRLLA